MPRLLDPAEPEAEGVGDPGSLDPPPREALSVFEVKSADQMPEEGGNERGPRPSGDEPKGPARHRHLAVRVGDALEERAEGRRLLDRQIVGRSRKAQSVLGPIEEAGVPEPPERLVEPPGESPVSLWSSQVVNLRGEQRFGLASPRVDLMGGEPDAEVNQTEDSCAGKPPRRRPEEGR